MNAPSGNWSLAIDGPADVYSCGSVSGCQRSAFAIEQQRHELYCFVAVRAPGTGNQVRMHYKGYAARFNEWNRANELRQTHSAEVDSFIQKHQALLAPQSTTLSDHKRVSRSSITSAVAALASIRHFGFRCLCCGNEACAESAAKHLCRSRE